jgi:hypothetical protein
LISLLTAFAATTGPPHNDETMSVRSSLYDGNGDDDLSARRWLDLPKQPGVEFVLTYFDNPGLSIPSAVSTWVAMTGTARSLLSLLVHTDRSVATPIHFSCTCSCWRVHSSDPSLPPTAPLRGQQLLIKGIRNNHFPGMEWTGGWDGQKC